MLRTKETDLSKLLKKLRHFHINGMICVQTTKSIPKDLKRTVSDIVLFPGISQYDFEDLINQYKLAGINLKMQFKDSYKKEDFIEILSSNLKRKREVK